MLKELINKFVYSDRKEELQIKKFEQMINFAESVIQKGDSTLKEKHPVLDIIRLLGRRTQSEMISDILHSEEEVHAPNHSLERLLFNHTILLTEDGRDLIDFKKRVRSERAIKLKRDLVLPTPGKQSKLLQTLTKIGFDREWGPWTQDRVNHKVEVWLPMGIAWVHSGNHSIIAGIIRSEGIIKTNNIYDISEIYRYVYCDGLNFYRKEDNSIIAPVQNLEFAAIFEIGRRMKEKKISF
ncbi:hypothetical protein GCM10008967_30750 [Bacillus carboniphilus]|uniref:Uncharacterized protein n=1 Tax=Bacillus carboniphilus TaxID=86663 RepID=A0ABN0WHT8_9BACI